jgi:hypothetical protein
MNAILLSQGKYALVDAADFPILSQWKWHAVNVRSKWYAVRNVYTFTGRRLLQMHREILNPPKEVEVDHVNGDGLDNRRENLRVATHHENSMNKPKRRRSSFGFRRICKPQFQRRKVCLNRKPNS